VRRLARGPVAALVALWMVVALLATTGGVGDRLLRIIVWGAIVAMVVGAIVAVRRRIEPQGPRALDDPQAHDDESSSPRRRVH